MARTRRESRTGDFELSIRFANPGCVENAVGDGHEHSTFPGETLENYRDGGIGTTARHKYDKVVI
jgi:hypothetical protein